ncbi:MAG: bacillithiol system redox-active protein YtxJ [Blastocatellia bacterium]|nr:bacillithiol system redox-active protein YtxJ [Blastocatellia bacterium]
MITPTTFNKIRGIVGLDALIQQSAENPVAIFKHSNRCGISAHVFEMLGSVTNSINYVVVQEDRELSDEIEARFGFRHHTPQAFVIKDGKAVYHASHYSIDPAAIDAEFKS